MFKLINLNNQGSALSVESEEDTRDYIYTDIAIYNDHEWAAKELSRAATYIIKGSGRKFRIEMKEVGKYFCRNFRIEMNDIIVCCVQTWKCSLV